jgi:hypothetical protein
VRTPSARAANACLVLCPKRHDMHFGHGVWSSQGGFLPLGATRQLPDMDMNGSGET